MNEPETYERIGAATGLFGAIIGLVKLGTFKAVREWWNRPTDTARLSMALEKIDATVRQIGAALESVSETLRSLGDNFIIAEAMTRAIADRDDTPMYQCELPSGRCVWTNKALQNMFGRTREQMMGDGWAEAVVPEFQQRVLHHWRDAIVNSDIYACDYPIEAHGGIVNVRAHADFIFDKAGRKIIAIGTVKPMPVMQRAA